MGSGRRLVTVIVRDVDGQPHAGSTRLHNHSHEGVGTATSLQLAMPVPSKLHTLDCIDSLCMERQADASLEARPSLPSLPALMLPFVPHMVWIKFLFLDGLRLCTLYKQCTAHNACTPSSSSVPSPPSPPPSLLHVLR